MKTEGRKITEATEDELFSVWLEKELDEIMSFFTFVAACQVHGTRIVEQGTGNREA